MRRRRVVAASVAGVALAFVVGLGGIGTTDASWTTAETGTGTLTAGTVNPPTSMSCNQPALQTPIYTWGVPAAGGLAISGYHITLTNKATGVVAASTDQTGTSIQPTAGGLLTVGSYTVTVVTNGPGGWTSVPGPTATFNVLLGLLTSCSVP